MANKKTDPQVRFWRCVHKTDTCWLWIGRLALGYGVIHNGEKEVGAHRFSYEIANGKIPEGIVLNHKCGMTFCVNPDHLEPTTNEENSGKNRNQWGGKFFSADKQVEHDRLLKIRNSLSYNSNKKFTGFWSRVNKTENCWVWVGFINYSGYGLYLINRKRIRAHRYAYEQLVGKIPEGKVLDHLCRNRACVNPSHLEVVTQSENARRMPKELRRQKRPHTMKIECVAGHKFEPGSFYSGRKGKECRICNILKSRYNSYCEYMLSGKSEDTRSRNKNYIINIICANPTVSFNLNLLGEFAEYVNKEVLNRRAAPKTATETPTRSPTETATGSATGATTRSSTDTIAG